MRAVFIYPNPRRALAAAVARGESPDSGLMGQNHLASLGIDAVIHDPPLAGGSRLTWMLREAVAVRGLPPADVVVSGLGNALPVAARVRSLPVVLVNYGLNNTFRRAGAARRQLLRLSVGSAARVISFGRSQSDDLAEFVAPQKLVPVHYGMDAEWWRPQPDTPRDEGLIVTVGKDLARDYPTFGEALRGMDARAVVVALPRNLVGVSLPANTIVDWLPLDSLRDHYARAACVVIPQRPTGFRYGADGGITTLLEAMAMASPIVATDRPMIREYVQDGVEALLVPAEDPAALREAIERVRRDPRLARSLGAAARARLEREFTSQHFAERLAGVLRSVT